MALDLGATRHALTHWGRWCRGGDTGRPVGYYSSLGRLVGSGGEGDDGHSGRGLPCDTRLAEAVNVVVSSPDFPSRARLTLAACYVHEWATNENRWKVAHLRHPDDYAPQLAEAELLLGALSGLLRWNRAVAPAGVGA